MVFKLVGLYTSVRKEKKMYIIFLKMKKRSKKKQEQYQFLQSSAKKEFQLLYQTLLNPNLKYDYAIITTRNKQTKCNEK